MQTKKKALERHAKMLDLIDERQSMRVDELCEIFSCSPATMRNDLRFLESQGAIKRIHGGVLSNEKTSHNSSMEKRLENHPLEKEEIANYVVEHLIHPHMIISLDSGTTTLALAKRIVQAKIPCTVLTNSFDAAKVLIQGQDIDLYLAGGAYDKKHRSFHDESADLVFRNFRSQIAFLSPNGINELGVITNAGSSENTIKKRMIQQAQQTILLMDHSKIQKTELNILCTPQQVHMLVVDSKTTSDQIKMLKSAGLPVVCASSI